MEEEGRMRYGLGSLGIGDGQGRGYEGGVWSIIKDKIASMECVEHNTTIGHNVINEYGKEEF